jgi:hypothetical protein
MTYPIFDTPDDCTADARALYNAGIRAVVRYDDPSGNPNSWKQIGVPEYEALLTAGLAVGFVSEWANDHAGYFSASAGTRDGNYSVMRARTRNQPAHSAIYAAVDYDALQTDLDAYVAPFFKTFAAIIRTAGYRVGCYGSGLTCAYLKSKSLIDLVWITCSSGFQGSRAAITLGNYDLWQVFGMCDQTYMGLSVDWDSANPARSGDWGQVIPGGKPPAPVYDVAWMQAELNRRGATPPLATDGILGPATTQAMIAYLEQHAGGSHGQGSEEARHRRDR